MNAYQGISWNLSKQLFRGDIHTHVAMVSVKLTVIVSTPIHPPLNQPWQWK